MSPRGTPRQLKAKALLETEVSLGTVRPPAENTRRPPHFGSASDEYAAATTAAACFDLSDRTLLELTGADRARFLHSFSTNDIKRLSAGQGCEAFIVNVKGRVVGHVWIDAGLQSLWLDADKGSAERLIGHLERYVVNEDVAIADRTADWGTLLVTGPEAAGGLGRLGIDVAGLANLDHRPLDVDKARARVRRFDVGPHPGYVLFVPSERLAEFWARLCEAGVRPAGEEVWTALRIEAGLPQYGVDISDENLAQEVGRTKSAISFTKGCYLGQEPIARIDAMGHVNRELRSLRLESDAVPALQSRVFSDAAGTSPVGSGAAGAPPLAVITSAAFSFAQNAPVALAVLRRGSCASGSRVFVEMGDALAPATVFWYPLSEKD